VRTSQPIAAIVEEMSARTRVYVTVAVVALASAGAAVGVTLLTGQGPNASAGSRLKGKPLPLLLDLGVRTDPEARALRRASRLYADGRRADAGRIFGRYDSVPAQIGAVLADWPRNTVSRLRVVAALHPQSALAQLHYGAALLFAGQGGAAERVLRELAQAHPDTLAAVRAGNVLHRNMGPNLPPFRTSFAYPARIARLAPPAQLRELARAASAPSPRAKLRYGVALQILGKPVSAERQFRAAAKLAPRDADAQVAAAVGLFDKDHPEVAFSHLGPLVRRFPDSPSVRFHLGVLLLWIGKPGPAKQELALARADGPQTRIGREAAAFLKRLRKIH
jgi:tetratricopeptide (TPR) repeat protein